MSARLASAIGALFAILTAAPPTTAHELRPAYLELRETAAGTFDVLWKTPMRGDLRLALEPEFSGRSEVIGETTRRRAGGAMIETWRLRADEPLRGRSLRIRGLEATMTDALARIEFADGGTWLKRLTPAEPAATIPASQSGAAVAREYLVLGVEHILTGYDHLAFVLGLLLLVDGFGRLLKTVSAFTLSHSVTLSLAALGYVHVPSAPVEAVIALSIVFVAREALAPGADGPTLAARRPWLVAFGFGLLHGLGFAGALGEVGLPEGHIPLALLFFSAGVEVGHFAFVGAVLGAIATARTLALRPAPWMRALPAHAIGAVASFWLIERVIGFW